LIAIARRYCEDLVESGIPSERIELIDDGVDLNLFSPSQADSTYLARTFGMHDDLLVGVVGRISEFKRVHDFLEIISRMPPESDRSVNFVVVGDWEDAPYHRRIDEAVARLRLAHRVRFIGRLPDSHAPQLLSSLDLLVTLSGGSVMFEAMAMGTPVMSIRTDGRHSEHTRHGHTAWCVNGDSAEESAAALSHLLRNETLRGSLGREGRVWVERQLGSQTMIDKIAALYERLSI
jgi:glycosyltransferase involved in cell wall biosynthesis